MNPNYISTASLYDSGAHLSHARQYSHKYIRREPDGKGGYRYWYRTDIGSYPGVSSATTRPTNAYQEYYVEKIPDTNDRFIGATAYNASGKMSQMVGGRSYTNLQKKFRQADKASQIYLEGQSQNEKDYKDRVTAELKAQKKARQANSKRNTIPENRIYENVITENVITETDQLRVPESNSKSSGDYAKKAVDTISTAAGSLYDKGKNFLKNLFK